MKKRRILVVDDNRDAAEALRTLMRMAGHEVRAAYDGTGALAAAAEFAPEAVLLDIWLPDMDGFELARHLRSHAATRDALLVAVTGHGGADDVQRSRAAGIDEHLTKPLDLAKLGEYLQRGRH